MKRLIFPFLPALLLIATACEKVIEAKDLPQQDPMLVVNCLLYPDSQITMNVSASKSILSGKDYKYINNAVCDLYEDDVYLGTVSTATNGNYVFGAKAKAAKKYSIKVGATSFKSVDAVTSIPGDVVFTSIERYDTVNSYYMFTKYSSSSSLPDQLGGTAKYKFSILDDPAVRNYYSIRPRVFIYDAAGNMTEIGNVSISSNITSLENNDYNGPGLQLDDQTIVNGKEIQADVSLYFNYPIYNGFVPARFEVFMEISSLSEDFYKYQKTLADQATTSASFFAEPVLVYNNISHGAGILAGTFIKTVKVYPQ